MKDAPTSSSDHQALLAQLAERTGIDTDELQSMLEAAKRGEDVRSYFGLTPEVLTSFEGVATSYYSSKLYEQAEPIFRLLIVLSDNERSSAWRGVAACRQALLDFDAAIAAYTQAIVLDPNDSISATYLAECLMLTGQHQVAVGLLDALIEDAEKRNDTGAHIKRARALRMSAKEVDAGAVRLPAKQERPASAAGKAVANQDHIVPEPIPADPEIQAWLQMPKVAEQFEELSRLFHLGAVTLRDIADFSQEQMDAGYAVCCTLLEQQNFARCLEIGGWMLYIDSHDARFYQLSGLAALNLELFCLAEYLFEMDTIWREGGPDAATMIYKGEAHIRQNEFDEGLAAVARGIELAAGRREYREVVQRGQLLQQVYAA